MDQQFGAPPTLPPGDPQPARWWEDRFRLTVVISTITAGIVVAGLLAVLALNARGGEPVAGASASPTGSLSTTTGPTSSASPSQGSEPASPTPQASATATAQTDQQARLEEGWQRVLTAVNLREQPGIREAILRPLRPDEVIHVVGDPRHTDGYDWYMARTSGFSGWIASGPPDDPFVELISADDSFRSCGPVTSDNGIRINGLLSEPFDEVERGVLQVAAATDADACVDYAAQEHWVFRYLSVRATGCGAPAFGPSGFFALRPTSAGNVSQQSRIAERVNLPNSFFFEGAAEVDGELTNRWTVFLLAKFSAHPLACVRATIVQQGDGNWQRDLEAWLEECLIVSEISNTHVTVSPLSKDPTFRLGIPDDTSLDPIPVDEQTKLRVLAATRTPGEQLEIKNLGSCAS